MSHFLARRSTALPPRRASRSTSRTFDAEAALQAAEIPAALESSGQRVGIRDVQIAGMARAHQAPVATRNVRDFEHSCTVIDPWHDPSP